MKYAQFTELCGREWQAGPPFGDVTALTLPGPSAAELAADVFASGVVELEPGDLPPGAVGIGLSKLPNPVTRSTVTITIDNDAPETATVSYGDFEYSPEPRTVAIA